MNPKDAAARKAVQYVQPNTLIGIGTGSTSAFAIRALGERVQREGLKIVAVPTSEQSRVLAEQLGIPLADLSEVGMLDLTFDGADEVDDDLNLIKGGGGALLREKIVASASRELVIIVDDSKVKPKLGSFPLPIAVVPFGHEATHRRLLEFTPNVNLRMDKADPSHPFVTDDHLYIYDMQMGQIDDPPALELAIRRIVGVAEVGLFIRMTSRLVIGYADGHTEEKMRDED